MKKLGKIILIGVVLIVIALTLVFLIKSNFSQRLAEVTSEAVDIGLGLNSLKAIDKAKEAVNLTDQTNKQINQMIENLTGTTTQAISTATSTN